MYDPTELNLPFYAVLGNRLCPHSPEMKGFGEHVCRTASPLQVQGDRQQLQLPKQALPLQVEEQP